MDRSRGGMGHFSITLPLDAVTWLDETAIARGLSRSAVVRGLVLEGIAREKRRRELAERDEVSHG